MTVADGAATPIRIVLADDHSVIRSGLRVLLDRETGLEVVGEAEDAVKFSDRLFEGGVFAQHIGFPTVPKGRARVRTIVTATHTQNQLQHALDTFARVGRETGLIA